MQGAARMQLDVCSLRLPGDSERLADVGVWRAVLEVFDQVGLLDGLGYHGAFGPWREQRPFADLDEVARAAALASQGAWELRSEVAETSEVELRLWVQRRMIRLQLHRLAGDGALAACQALLEALLARFPEGQLGPDVVLSVKGVPIPRSRPPRRLTPRPGAVAFWYDRAFEATSPLARRERHLACPPPDGASRVEDGRLLRLGWVDALDDRDALLAGLAARQAWLSRTVEGPIEDGYDARGDLERRPGRLIDQRPLSGYKPERRIGYKKIPIREGGFHRRWLELVAEWCAAGALPDGTPLDELWLLASDRETALRLKPFADEAGASGVLWIDKAGDTLWDPFPPGPWLDPQSSADEPS